MRRFLLAIAAVFLTAIPIAVLADNSTYNLSVPVTATNLPAGSKLQVTCTLYSGANGSGQTSSQNSPLTSVVGTQYSGPPFTFPALSAPFKAASYMCNVVAYGSGGNWISITPTNPPKPVAGWTGTWQTSANL